ncbi:hypothetical protein ACF3NR_06800 [Vaginella massiliensis]|uniref:hypothetical protein n=1 Tax=Vaginella massiliensis TaxID=1816680 RepID=UPI0012B5F1E6|nr:hypothetical protein [Vaginella massiliensis]
MKININKFICFISMMFSINIFAQVGIQTDQPTRMLDINGDLKVRVLKDKSSEIDSYSQVLVTDTNGNIDAINITDLKYQIKEEIIENKRLFYTDLKPNANEKLTCGRFQFSFRPSTSSNKNLDIMMNLLDDPKKEVTTYYTLFRKWGDVNLKYYKANGKTFNSSNYTQTQLLCPQLDVNSTGEFYISYPGEANYYRVTFLGRPNYTNNGNTYNSYTITCEKF